RQEALLMAETPPLSDMLRSLFERVDNDDVRLFYQYFDELKTHVRKYLTGKARQVPGTSHVAQSALFSLFCDVVVQQIPLQDVDEHGCRMLRPLLLKDIERQCEKWKKSYRAKKGKGAEVSLAAADAGRPSLDLPDHRGPAGDEEAVGAALDELYERLTP